MKRIDLEDRLIQFAVNVMELVNHLPKTKAGSHLQDQLSRSSISAALNYGEAQSAESKRAFIHKLKISLKELRESMIGLKIIDTSGILKSKANAVACLRENNELISIFVKSVETAQKNQN